MPNGQLLKGCNVVPSISDSLQGAIPHNSALPPVAMQRPAFPSEVCLTASRSRARMILALASGRQIVV